MTAPESFVSRWVRLKREVAAARRTEPVVEAPQPGTAVALEARSDAVQRGDEAAIEEAFDPASLPAIETIAADSDIRAFLHSRVPAELTRLALRRAWASDPAIRDFIGIAENQWDFNDPDAIPGFGPLQASDHHLPGLLQQALGNGDSFEQTLAAVPVSREQAPSPAPDREPTDFDRSGGKTLNRPPAIGSKLRGLAVDGGGGRITAGGGRLVEANDATPIPRSHGGALPRFKL